MSKTQTLALAVVSSIVVATTGIIGVPWLPWLFVYVGICSLLWYGYKRISHARLLKEAIAADQQEPALLAPVITSPGSSKLFVPQPLDRS